MIKHPVQPIILSDSGVERFKENKIVSYILNNGGINMNHLACQDFEQNDRIHFAQLIGYSVYRWGELSYVSDEDWSAAQARKYSPSDSDDAIRIEGLEKENRNLKDIIKSILAITQEIDETHLD